MKWNIKHKNEKSKQYIVTAAWPTINSVPHLGTVLQLLSADVITRYLRLLGEKVISVTGSDAHGTPILIASEKQKLTPEKYCENFQPLVINLLKKWSIGFDNYTITTNHIHVEFVQEFYKDLFEQKKVFNKDLKQFFCEKCSLFLPDRFIKGICPTCKETNARGDQCSNSSCRQILTPDQLDSPHCYKCKSTPTNKKTNHWFFRLSDYTETLDLFLKKHIKSGNTIINESISQIKQGLKSRALTRDLKWGISASKSFPDAIDKIFYVWAEDVLGYISASIPVLGRKWKKIWTDPETRTIFCFGIDNLFFHAIWYPALLLASSSAYVLPYALCITQFIQFENQAFSKSKGIGLGIDQVLKIAPSDYWRFYLILIRPESKGTNFSLKDFVKRINKDLIDTIGNLVYRVVKFIHQVQDGFVQRKFDLTNPTTLIFIADINETIDKIHSYIYSFELRVSLIETIKLARIINEFLSKQEPWKIKDTKKREEILTLIYLALIPLIRFLEPIIPITAQAIYLQLNFQNLKPITPNEKYKWVLSNSVKLPKLTFFLKKLSSKDIHI